MSSERTPRRPHYIVEADRVGHGAWHVTVRELPKTWTVAFTEDDIEWRARQRIVLDRAVEPDDFDLTVLQSGRVMAMPRRLATRLDERDCPHVAALLASKEDLPPVLASFYALGATRNGWLAHGSLPGEAERDREHLAGAGLAVDALEAEGRLSIVELDLTLAPEDWVDGWRETLDARLAEGFDAVWFGRFPIGPTDGDVDGVIPFEDAWMRRFNDRPMVTLCPYIVEGAAPSDRHTHDVASVHDDLLDLRAG